jgi:hypothetical protein
MSNISPLDKRNLTHGFKYKYRNYLVMTTLSSLFGVKKSTNNFTTGQSWGALRKAWKGYRIAKVQGDTGKMREYATKIRKIQGELGISVASFPNIGIQ